MNKKSNIISKIKMVDIKLKNKDGSKKPFRIVEKGNIQLTRSEKTNGLVSQAELVNFYNQGFVIENIISGICVFRLGQKHYASKRSRRRTVFAFTSSAVWKISNFDYRSFEKIYPLKLTGKGINHGIYSATHLDQSQEAKTVGLNKIKIWFINFKESIKTYLYR